MTKPFECPVCRGRYKSERGLAVHMARFHGGTQPEKPIDAMVSEVDGYFKQWANDQKLSREKLGESPVPKPRPVQVTTEVSNSSELTTKIDGASLHLVMEDGQAKPAPFVVQGPRFTRTIHDGARGVELPLDDIPAELYRESPSPKVQERPRITDGLFERLFGKGNDHRGSPRMSYKYQGSSHKKAVRKQRQMIAAMAAVMILMVPCAYYVATSGMFTPFITTPETPTSFEDVRDIEVIDAATEDDITGFVANFTLCTATDPFDWLTYHVVIQSPNMTAVLMELREYAYTPASFHVFLHIEFDSTYASTWAELVPMTHIHITCFEA